MVTTVGAITFYGNFKTERKKQRHKRLHSVWFPNGRNLQLSFFWEYAETGIGFFKSTVP